MRYAELTEKWSKKYKSSINCNNPKGFSQKAHCAGRKKNESVEKQITDQDLQQLETYADRLFASLGIDVEFSKHFKDRVNDPRNAKPITMAELTRLFKQIYKQHGKPIAQLGPDAEAVMKDMRTDVNVPFALQWDGQELDLVAKTVMRKSNFATPNQEFTVEAYMMDLNQDEDMLVLKVKDTDKPGHVEIRGKKNYETDGYDPKDPLHKVLDQLDPATVAKLYGNEEPVFLNPKNPRTEKTIAKAMQLMKEHGLVPMYHTMKAYKMSKAKHPDGSAYFKSDYPKYMENFADGKVKGKSRPGRVKRAGASCKGSVTDLRRKAKNSSGEKAKMYHWCANMKSGKKK